MLPHFLQGQMFLERVEKIPIKDYHSSLMSVYYIDRKTGQKLEEKVYGRAAIDFLYGRSSWLSFLFGFLLMHFFARIPWISKLAGYLQNRPSSAKNIAPFIQEFGIDSSEFEESHFRTFNDFFIRKIKPERRPIDSNPSALCLPADARYLVVPDLSKVDGFFVKGQKFNLFSFLKDPVLARRYSDGSLVLARLCPIDYHRFHFPCDGIASKPRTIKGSLYSVNPIALRKKISIFWENKRMVTEIESKLFGSILYVEIGATCVGTICQTFQPDRFVRKGEEKGYFSFGGSSIALLFEKKCVRFDEDLIKNSALHIETRAEFGGSLGRSLRASSHGIS